MSRSSSAVDRGPVRVVGKGLPSGALTPAGESGRSRPRGVEGSGHSPGDEAHLTGDLRLVLVTASGFEVPLVATPAQTARLLRISGGGETGGLKSRRVIRPRPVPVEQLLRRGRLVRRFETPPGGGAA